MTAFIYYLSVSRVWLLSLKHNTSGSISSSSLCISGLITSPLYLGSNEYYYHTQSVIIYRQSLSVSIVKKLSLLPLVAVSLFHPLVAMKLHRRASSHSFTPAELSDIHSLCVCRPQNEYIGNVFIVTQTTKISGQKKTNLREIIWGQFLILL